MNLGSPHLKEQCFIPAPQRFYSWFHQHKVESLNLTDISSAKAFPAACGSSGTLPSFLAAGLHSKTPPLSL